MEKKYLFFALMTAIFIMASPNLAQAQFLKNILNTVKNTATQNVNNKAANATNNTIDNIENAGKTKSNTNTNANTPAPRPAATSTANPTTQSTTQSTTSGQPSGNKANDNSTNEDTAKSYITLKLSARKIIAGGTVTITGASVMYQSLNKVALTISGSSGSETKSIPLKSDGSFLTTWQTGHTDDYTISAKSSDGKSQASAVLSVYEFNDMDSITQPNKEETKKAYDNLVKWIDKVKPELVPKDAGDLEPKMKVVTADKDKFLQFFDDVTAAVKGLDGVEKKYGSIPSNVSDNLSKLNDLLSTQAAQMEQLNDIAQHEPSDNTICEYLVMVNEACAAFITFTEFYAKCPAILANLASDRVVAPVAGAAGNTAGLSENNAEMTKEIYKLFSASKLDADWGEAVTSSVGKAGLAGELSQMCSEVFLKRYCVVMSGDLKEDYQCTFRNSNTDVWWQYSYTTEATVNMRYPKNNSGGKIIKMKGNIEGNATKFTIYQKASEMDEFKEAMKNRATLYSLQLYAPPTMPFSTSKADKNIGFGAVARAIVTPAYFNIPFDADYDVEAKKIKIYLNTPLMDFNPSLISYIYAYLTFPLGIPLVTRVNYPINNVKLTLGKVIEKNNDFDIKSDGENNLSVSKKGDFQIGDKSSAIEHNINFTLSASSE